MTTVLPHCPVKDSLRPAKSIGAAPVYGVESEQVEVSVDDEEAMKNATATPASGSIKDKKDDEVIKKDEVKNKEVVEEGDETRKPRIGRRPLLPTKADIDAHLPLHLNYRSWCAHCRAGRARIAPHICEPSDREKIGITVHSDYAFMGSEEADENIQPSLVIYDDSKDSFWAVGVRTKTVTEQLVKHFKDILDQSGYEGEKITMKSDQEASIVALKRAVSAARFGETVPIESPVRSSKSNGRMENAIGVWQGQLRTIKHYTETLMKRRIEIDSVLFSWLIPFCTDVVNKYRVGADGRTSYEIITGHKCKHQVIGFAEAVDFILEPNKQNMHKGDT